MSTTGAPRLTVGLPTYNGAHYLAQAVDDLLAQTFTDLELVISDNASTDETEELCRAYAASDPRVRYVRHPVNRGSAFNHNHCIDVARGELFKWASDDDRYAPDLLERAVAALDRRPDAVVAHAWTSIIDEDGVVTEECPYVLETDTADVTTRFRSLLYVSGGDDIYGVIRMSALRAVRHGSYHQADRVFVAQLSLSGPFVQVPEHLYFRREHASRTSRSVTKRERASRLDPRRASRWRHPMARILGEYVAGYVTAIRTAPVSVVDKVRLGGALVGWLLRRTTSRSAPMTPHEQARARR